MLTAAQLREIAKQRISDAEILFKEKAYEGAAYICGYSVEIGLKARICSLDWWLGFPSSLVELSANQDRMKKVITHDLEILLGISGESDSIKKTCLADWSIVVKWKPESRYYPPLQTSEAEARAMIDASRKILEVLKIL